MAESRAQEPQHLKITDQQRLRQFIDRLEERRDMGLLDKERFSELIVRLCEVYQNRSKRDNLLKQFLRHESFEKEVEEKLTLIHSSGLKGALMIIDIDYLKQINDTAGHIAGDQVIKKIAEIITENTRTSDLRIHLEEKESTEKNEQETSTQGRIGGDEFAVLLIGADETGASIVAERIRNAVPAAIKQLAQEEADIQKLTWEQTVSIGIAGVEANDNHESLKRRADEALYQAKQERNTISVYSPEVY